MSWKGQLRKAGIESDGKAIDLFRGSLKIHGLSTVVGSETVNVLIRDSAGKILFATGTTVPTGATAGYAKGCLFIDTNVGAGLKGLYENQGTITSCDFNAVGDFVAAEIALASAKILVGGAGGAAAAQSVSGDLTMLNTGVFSLSDRFRKRTLASIATVGAGTYLVADLLKGLIQRDPAGAARADTIDTAANIVGALTNSVIGAFIACAVHNIGSTGEDITITAGAGITLDSSLNVTIKPGQVATLLFVATNVTAAAEAVTVYRLDTPAILAEHVPLVDGKVLIGNATNLAEAQTPSGDVGVTNAGVISLIDRFRKRTITPIATAGPETLLAAALAGGVIQRDPNGAARADTFDSAANILAALTNPVVGAFIPVFVHNIGATTETITLTSPGADIVLDTYLDAVIHPGQVAFILLVATNIGVGTEEFTVYRLDPADVNDDMIATGVGVGKLALATGKVISGSAGGAGEATTPSVDNETPTNVVTEATKMFFYNNLAAAAVACHAAVQESAADAFPGPFTNPATPRSLDIVFDAGWQGGDVTVIGTDQFDDPVTEVFADNPGATVAGTKIFKTIVSASKELTAGTVDACQLQTGDLIGIAAVLAGAYGAGFVDGVAELFAWNNTYHYFDPTTAPNGAHDYTVVVPTTHNHIQNAHNHGLTFTP